MVENSDIISYSDMIGSDVGDGVFGSMFGWSQFSGGYDEIFGGVLMVGKLY